MASRSLPARLLAAFRAGRRPPALQVAKSVIATVAAWLVAGWLVPGPAPVFAAIAALLVVQPSLNQSFAKAIERTVGVIVGVLVAAALGTLLGNATWVTLAAITIALILAWALRMTSGAGNQVAISAMLVLTLGASAGGGYAADRIVETMIGAVFGFAVNVALVPPVTVAPARDGVRRLAAELADTLDRLGRALREPQTAATLTELIVSARLLRPMRERADAAIAAASESLTMNPRARSHRADLDEQRALLAHCTTIVTQVIGMTRAFCDAYDDGLRAEPAAADIADQLHRSAHDVRLLLQRADGGDLSAPDADEQALTRPLTVAAPRSGRWVLVGSLLVDLRRIHDTLTDDDAPVPH